MSGGLIKISNDDAHGCFKNLGGIVIGQCKTR